MLFSYLLQCVIVTCNEIGFKSCVFQLNVRHCFCVVVVVVVVLFFFALINKIITNCVMMNKMVWNERMSPFEHVHII